MFGARSPRFNGRCSSAAASANAFMNGAPLASVFEFDEILMMQALLALLFATEAPSAYVLEAKAA